MNERSERDARWFELPMLIAALLVIPVIAIEQSSLAEPWDTIAAVLNWTTWLVFLVELLVMLALVDDRRRYLREHPLDLLLVVLTPPILPPGLQSLRVLRLLRILRLLRVAPIARRLFSLDGLRYAAFLALLTLVGGAAAFQVVEPVSRVSRLMGHANEAITLGVYAHEIERHENAERTRESMRVAFGSGTILERSGEKIRVTEPEVELPKVASLRAFGDE